MPDYKEELERIKSSLRCGYCLNTLDPEQAPNVVKLNKKCYDKNLFSDNGAAIAVLCDGCKDAKREPKFALHKSDKVVVVIDVDKLDDWNPKVNNDVKVSDKEVVEEQPTKFNKPYVSVPGTKDNKS